MITYTYVTLVIKTNTMIYAFKRTAKCVENTIITKLQIGFENGKKYLKINGFHNLQ